MTDLLDAAGGATEPLRALLVGGYFGTWVEASQAMRLRLAREDLRSVGCSLGSGVLIALGESACGLHESARVIDYLAAQSAGQCGPCTFGLRAIADAMGALADGDRPRRATATACCAGRPRSAGAAPATTPTARCGSSRARCRCSPRRSSGTAASAAARSRRACRWPGRRSGRPRGARRRAAGEARDERAAARQSDRLRGARPVRGAAARADPARRLGLPDHRRARGAARAARARDARRRRLSDAGAAARGGRGGDRAERPPTPRPGVRSPPEPNAGFTNR